MEYVTAGGCRLEFERDLTRTCYLMVPEASAQAAEAVAGEPDSVRLIVEVPGMLLHAFADAIRPAPLPIELPAVAAIAAEPEDGHHVRFAIDELERSGQTAEDPEFAASIVAAVRGFFSYPGHSGGSAMVAMQMLDRLLHHRELSPLTDDPAEWRDVSSMMDKPCWQNLRSPSSFSYDGGRTWYDQDAEGEPSALRHACAAVAEMYPGREVETISGLHGSDGIAIRFKGEPDVAHLTAAEVFAAAGRVASRQPSHAHLLPVTPEE